LVQKVIEFYIRTEKLPVGTKTVYELIVPGHECTRKAVTDAIVEYVLPEVENATLKLLEELCSEGGVRLKIYDVRTFGGRVRARFKGVNKTPTIIFGENRIEGIAEREKIVSLFK
jgi:hypothetical protein